MSAHSRNLTYEFGQWQIHLGQRELLSSGAAVPLGARAFEIIEILVQSANELVTKSDLMDRIWPGAFVGENTLHVHISAIRKALGKDRAMLQTASGRGYRLLGSWTLRQQGSQSVPIASPPMPETGASPAHNFPLNAGRLIGRAAAARQVRDLVSAYRVVTLTGPGGIGKTSLAVEAVRDLVTDFNGGGCFVDLASLSNPDLVSSAVASALGLRLSGEISAESVARAVGERHLLLVLDNCEHVVDAAASLAECFTRRCPQITILATSREVLRVAGEAVYRVSPLEVPSSRQQTPEEIRGYGAVELFIARLNALDVGFSARNEELTSLAAICRRLDGIPLAIEFAAASAATLGIASVAEGLRDSLALLTGGRRTALARQRTLRATLDWSYELLVEVERQLFRRLAVFPAGFTLDGAVAVMLETGRNAARVTDRLSNLVAKSMVARDAQNASRWYLLETIRTYALEKLVEHGEAERVAGRYAIYVRDLVTSMVSSTGSTASDKDLERCVVEIDNVRAVLDWCFAAGGDATIGVDLTTAYAPVWQYLSLMGECRRGCERALLSLAPDLTANTRPRMQLQIALANAINHTMGSPATAITLLTQALEAADNFDDLGAQMGALIGLWNVFIFRDEYAGARNVVNRLEQIADRIDDPASFRVAYRLMGNALFTSGRHREAQRYYERVLPTPVAPEDRQGAIRYISNDAVARAMLARVLWIQGFTERALNEACAGLEELHGTDHQIVLCRVLYYGICRLAIMTGDFATADRQVARLIEVGTRLNADFWETAGHFLKGKLLVERGEFAQGLAVLRDAFATCGQTGWRLSYPEFKGALALAFAGTGQLEEALGAVEDAITSAGEPDDGQVWYVPELLRIKGEVLLRHAADQFAQAAENCFRQAAEMAIEQGALFWELRIALSVARLKVSQDRRHEARAPLAAVYDRFTEGFITKDLLAASAMLDELAVR